MEENLKCQWRKQGGKNDELLTPNWKSYAQLFFFNSLIIVVQSSINNRDFVNIHLTEE